MEEEKRRGQAEIERERKERVFVKEREIERINVHA